MRLVLETCLCRDDLVAVLQQLDNDASVFCEVLDCCRAHDVGCILIILILCTPVGQYQHRRRTLHL